MINKILLAVDGSKNAQRATDMAAELAGKLAAELVIVHVMMHGRPPEELVRMAEVEHLVKEAQSAVAPGTAYVTGTHLEMIRSMASNANSMRVISALGEEIVARAKTRCTNEGVKSVTTSVRAGDYAEEILEAAQLHGVDLIVIGSRGLGVLKSTVLGSVSQKVLHHAACSVLTVR